LNRSGHTLLASYLYDGTVNAYAYNSVQKVSGDSGLLAWAAVMAIRTTRSRKSRRSLVAGHSYSWSTTAFTQAYPDPDTETPANGGVSLAIAPVPEFSSVFVWSLLGVTIGGAGWWRRSKSAA